MSKRVDDEDAMGLGEELKKKLSSAMLVQPCILHLRNLDMLVGGGRFAMMKLNLEFDANAMRFFCRNLMILVKRVETAAVCLVVEISKRSLLPPIFNSFDGNIKFIQLPPLTLSSRLVFLHHSARQIAHKGVGGEGASTGSDEFPWDAVAKAP